MQRRTTGRLARAVRPGGSVPRNAASSVGSVGRDGIKRRRHERGVDGYGRVAAIDDDGTGDRVRGGAFASVDDLRRRRRLARHHERLAKRRRDGDRSGGGRGRRTRQRTRRNEKRRARRRADHGDKARVSVHAASNTWAKSALATSTEATADDDRRSFVFPRAVAVVGVAGSVRSPRRRRPGSFENARSRNGGRRRGATRPSRRDFGERQEKEKDHIRCGQAQTVKTSSPKERIGATKRRRARRDKDKKKGSRTTTTTAAAAAKEANKAKAKAPSSSRRANNDRDTAARAGRRETTRADEPVAPVGDVASTTGVAVERKRVDRAAVTGVDDRIQTRLHKNACTY